MMGQPPHELRLLPLITAAAAAAAWTVPFISSCGGGGSPAGEVGAPSRSSGDSGPAEAASDTGHSGPEATARDSDDSGAGLLEPNAVVERVVDGDTIVAEIAGRSEPVRLLGIDTPESVAPTRPVQCYGKEASQYLEQLLPAGTGVTLVLDAEARDVYDRLLAYVVRSDDGLFVNLELVDEGYADVLNYPPNDHYADLLARAASSAAGAGRGLWGACGGPDVPLH